MKYTRVYECGYLAGYQCAKGFIEKNVYNITRLGNEQYDYIVKELVGTGKAARFNTFAEAKAALENM